MLDLVSNFSDKNNGKFNDELILNLRQKDQIVKNIDDVCKAVTQLISEHITYLGYHYIDSRSRMLERDNSDEIPKNSSKNDIYININDTYAKEAIFEFECNFKGERVKQNFTMWIPMLIDNSHFYIRGNKYSCPIQIIDAITFTNKNVLVLKTITRALKFERQACVISDIYGNKFNTSKIIIYATKKGVSVLLYYFATFGFFKTLKYFGVDQFINLYSSAGGKDIPKDQYLFKFGTAILGVNKQAYDSNLILQQFVASVLATAKRTMTMDFIRNPVEWTALLGKSIYVQESFDKGNALLKTFKNVLDAYTKEIINELVPGQEKEDIFSVVRWIFVNYTLLTYKDQGLQNMRLRLGEYLVSPFIKLFTEKVYRFMNTPNVLKSMDHLMDIFKIKSTLIINAIIGKISHQMTGLNIAKYSNECNDDALVNTLLLCTKSGPGTPMSSSKQVSSELRQFPIDYTGNICYVSGNSAGSPGIHSFLCPLCDTYDARKKIFNIDPVLIKN